MRCPAAVVAVACLVEGSNQHHYHYHRRGGHYYFNIIEGFIFTIFSGGGVRGGLNWAVTVGSCGGEGYNGGVGQ